MYLPIRAPDGTPLVFETYQRGSTVACRRRISSRATAAAATRTNASTSRPASEKLTFSGRVLDETTMQPVSGASVEVSGTGTVTNAQGWFTLQVPPTAAPERYVLNVRHPQYALLSRVHDKESTGNTYELIRAQNTIHPPGAINVVDTSSSGPCGGDEKQTSGATATPFRAVAKRGDRIIAGRPKSNVKSGEQEPCRHRGARILIPASALVDAKGNVPAGPVQASMATLNPARRTLPGDYRAVTAASTEAELLSYGALHAEFRDSSGGKLNLKPGTTAEIRVPVSAAQLPSAPPSIAIWSYDEKGGLWLEEGTGTLQNTADGWMYVGKTTHFSELNMDVAGNDPAQATCVRFEIGASLAGWTNLVVRAYVSYAGQFSQVKETALDGAQYHAVFRIPYAPPAPPPNTLRLELRGTYLGTTVVLLDDIIATDFPRPKMTGLDLWPDGPDYSECGDVITLEADPVTLPYYGDIDATGRPAFLTGPYGQFLPEDGEQIATDYYNTIDPANANYPTLETWWTGHGFNADGTGRNRRAVPELQRPRVRPGHELPHDRRRPGLLRHELRPPRSEPGQRRRGRRTRPGQRAATVAMEYIASEPSDRRVRFYVYSGGDPAAAGKLKFADLDGLGPKPVPHLCIVCHGGQYDAGANNAAVRASASSTCRRSSTPSDARGITSRRWRHTTLDENELTASRTSTSWCATSRRPPVRSGRSSTTGTRADSAPAPRRLCRRRRRLEQQRRGDQRLSQRACEDVPHLPRRARLRPGQQLHHLQQLHRLPVHVFVVCDDPKVMPNAFVTYKNFWSDPLRVIEYASLTGGGTCD